MDAKNVERTITLLRSTGFVENIYQPRDKTLPKGIWRRREQYILKNTAGTYVHCDSLPEAIAAQTCCDEAVDGACAEPDADEAVADVDEPAADAGAVADAGADLAATYDGDAANDINYGADVGDGMESPRTEG